MSVRPRDRRPVDIATRQEDKIRMNLSNIIDNINNNNLVHFYPKDESLFKKRIDKLNLKFYIETEKYLTNKNDMEKCQDQLFIILFKQISLYIEEVERLNFLLREKIEDEKTIKEKIDEMQKREREKSTMQLLINNLRSANKALEKRVEDKSRQMEKLKTENESLNRQIKFYQEKLQMDLKKSQEIFVTKKKRNLDEYLNNAMLTNDTANVGSNSNSQNIIQELDMNSNNTNFNSNSSVNNMTMLPPSSSATSTTASGAANNSTKTFNKTGSKNFNENLTLSKILNKKRNYSDNNPNQVKKGVNIVSVSINNRYNDASSTGTNFFTGSNGSGTVPAVNGVSPIDGEKIKREITKSSIVHKNVNMNIKSPQRSEDAGQGNSNLTVNKKPASDSKGLYKHTSKNYKDFKIIKSIKQQNKKNDSQDKASDVKVNSPKGCSKFINLHYDPTMFQLNSTGTNTSTSSNLNENFLQDQLMTTFNSFDDEIAYLVELEKALKNTKLMMTASPRDARPSVSIDSNAGLEEIYKRSESVEYNYNNGVTVFSDEENEGYKSGASCLSDKQYSFKNKKESKKTITTNTTAKTANGTKPYPSVTIDLIKGMGQNTYSKRKKEMMGYLSKVKKI